jgi:tetratricopeptide (TPR) repeat protein
LQRRNLINQKFKEMKKNFYALMVMLVGSGIVANAQAQSLSSEECMQKVSIFNQHVKVGNFDAAFTPWKEVYDQCPDAHTAIYSDGEKILKDRIKKGTDKDASIKLLMEMYDKSREHFPKKFTKSAVAADKATIMYQQKLGSDQEMFNLLDKTFAEDRANFKNPLALYLYFASTVKLHEAGSKEVQEVFDTYDDVTEKIDEENKKLSKILDKYSEVDEKTLNSKQKRELRYATVNSEAFGKFSNNINVKLGQLANCENLIPLYQKTFEQNKGDIKWVKRAVGRMFSKECSDDPLFVKLVEAQNTLEPSASSEFYLGYLKEKSGDSNGAIAHYNRAVELETDSYEKAKILYKIATSLKRKGAKASSRSYAQKALQHSPSMGKAYLLIANLYASSANQCGTTTFEKRAVYWKAADMARKAARVDPSVAGTARKTADAYMQRAPSRSDIFSASMAGKTIQFNCWIGGSVKVPNL